MRCQEKRKHRTQRSAIYSAMRMKKKHPADGPEFDPLHQTLDVYRCRRCGCWHVGHDIKQVFAKPDAVKLKRIKPGSCYEDLIKNKVLAFA